MLFGPAGRPLPQLPLDDRRARRAARRGQLLRRGRPVVVGRAQQEAEGVIREARPLPRRAHGGAPFLQEGAALRLPGPLVVPPRRGRALLVHPPRRDRDLPDALLRSERRATTIVYHGSYEPLRGQEMTPAYASVVDLSLDVKAGLLIRQTHHWAANVFVAAIVLHLLRVFFTGAFRKPRDLTYYIGLTMLDARAARGLPRLLDGRRPALGDGARDRLLGGALDPVRRREPRRAHLGRAVSRAPTPSGRGCTSRTSSCFPILIGDAARACTCCSSRCATTRSSGRGARRAYASSAIPAFPG